MIAACSPWGASCLPILLLIFLFLLEDALRLGLGIGIRELVEGIALVSVPQDGCPHVIVALHIQLTLKKKQMNYE